MKGIFDDKDKNLFPIGGLMPIDIPAVFRGVGRKLRDRMYKTIRPEEYSLEQVENFVKGTPRQYYRNPNVEALLGKYTGQDSIIADYTQAPDYLTGGRYLTEEEKARLGVDSESTLKKYAVDDIIVPSKSKEGAFEFAYPNRLGSVPHLPTNANRIPDDSWPHSHELGTFHQVKTNNNDGSSVTYEDTYDINPFRGKSSEDDSTWRGVIRIGKKVGLDKIGDIVPWGKPFEMHGQQSYDKEGYPKKAEGGFLQPKDAWDGLSMQEKAEMIKVAVNNGITNLKDIRQKYNEFAEGGSKEDEEVVNTDEQYLNTMERVAQDNYQKWGFSNPDEALLHALNDNTYNYRGYYGKYPQSRANADTHWTDEFKTVWHPTFSNESIYSGQKSQYNPIGLPGGFWSGDTFIPMAWQLNANEYKKGGDIHIKPSHKGRLTELKKRTGKTEAELYRTGGPAVRKMITFARSARKWKHEEGGPLQGPIIDMAMANMYEDGGDVTPEGKVFQDFVVKASEDPMVVLAKQNPDYRQTLSDMYDTFLTKPQATRLLNVYNEAGKPKLRLLPEDGNRAFTRNNIFMSKPVMYLSNNGKDPDAGFYDLIAELAHPIQSKYGNNKSWKERINPFYHEDDYRGKTRYDFPNKYESETHEDFEPLLHYYVIDNWLPSQGFLTSGYEGEKEIGDNNNVFNPEFPKQVMDSARVYNRRKQDMNYQYKNPRGERIKRNKLLSFFGDLF